MIARAAILLTCVLASVTPLAAQTSADGVSSLLVRLQGALQSSDPARLSAVFSPVTAPAQVEKLLADLTIPDRTRTVVRERDRFPLPGSLPGDGYRVVVEVFTETARRARVITARLDVRRPRDGDPDSWRVTGAERLTTVEGLYRLRIDPAKLFDARGLTLRSEDLVLTLHEGSVFHVDSEAGVTGLVLLGRGEVRFTPEPEAEKTQLRIFSDHDSLVTPFDTLFVRFSPGEYESRVKGSSLRPVAVDQRALRRADEILAREGPKSFNLDLRDLSSEPWYLLPPPGDFVAEIRTRRHGTVTYARTMNRSEDVTLFDRERQRTISLYASAAKLATRSRFYNEDDLSDYDVIDYDISVTVTPQRETLEGQARVTIRVRSDVLSSLTLRLAEQLTVRDVVSVEFGRLLHFRVRNQNSVVVNLPVALTRETETTLVVTYSGELPSQRVDGEALALAGQDTLFVLSTEPHYLLSNRASWYPQGEVTDYATATLRITVPEGFGCVASGTLLPAAAPGARGSAPAPPARSRTFVFRASDPVRYLAVIVTRLSAIASTTLRLQTDSPVAAAGASAPFLSSTGELLPGFRVRDTIDLSVQANPRLTGRGRERLAWTVDILRFYAGLLGDVPYPSLTVALVEDDLPGGHSPAHFAVLNNPLPSAPVVWRNDPAAFTGFPEFFLAHELAHQWWGQAVGWKSYHEQWISEGFAQYFSALYAQKVRGDSSFEDMLRQFRRWALSESAEGPIYLGYRLGHIDADSRVFRALVYNKGAAVLHMLRRLLGDEVFFTGLRRFYEDHKFQKAGTDDLQRTMEAESGRSLARFFERWIYGAALPRLRYETALREGELTVRFEQLGELVFDFPITVTITYADGREQDVVVPVLDKLVEQRIPTLGTVKQVQINRDSGALAHIEGS
jgi:hypothetical protein